MLAGSAHPGWAHAILMESVPADGATLGSAPGELRLRFNEPVTPIRVQLLDPQGRDAAAPEAASAENDGVRLALPPGLPTGLYVASYRVTSADGHPVTGSFTFGIGVTPQPAGPAAETDDPSQPAALAGVLLRTLHYASLLAGTGGGLFLLLVTGRWSPLGDRLKPGLCLMLLAAALSALLLVGTTGVVLTGRPLADLATGAAWSTGAASSVGLSAGVALLAMLCSASGLALDSRRAAGPALLVAGAVLGAASLAVTGHAATASPRWLSAPLVGVHGLMAAVWVGALWPLTVALRLEAPAEAARLTRRFSRLAVAAVAILLGAGGVLSVIQLGSVDALYATGYGWLWSAKMLAVLALLGLAAWNKWSLTPALDRGDGRPASLLRRSVALEMAAVGAALLLTAAFALTPPPRALDAAGELRHAGLSTAIVKGDHMALVDVNPAVPGVNGVQVHLQDAQGQPLAAREVTLEWELPAAGVAPLRRTLSVLGPGLFGADDVTLPLSGRWSLRLDVLVDEFDKQMFRTELPIGSTATGAN
ncbi:hypothetical protein TSO352_09390 [Azospirillum sp. TSO35-2]|nr:hypothetical protein TSO352_09390 [Azospirillum sp. TSO35-2]